MNDLTAAEQMMVELLNRARLDPLGEAARFGLGDLNDGLAPGTITAAPKQALAPNALLAAAAAGHSRWMLEQDIFSHTGAGGSSPTERMQDAGFTLDAPWRTGENIAFWGTTGTVDADAAIFTHHEGLFLSAGHRTNILQDDFREIGIGQELGSFTTQGSTFNASMLTQNFARSGSAVFVTGVIYDDTDGDGFYSIGEGRGGLGIAAGGQGGVAQSAGGYALALAPGGMTEVRLGSGPDTVTVAVDLSAGNAKLDLVDGTRVAASADLELRGGVTEAMLLGAGDLSLTGGAAAEQLVGNAGDNRMAGRLGADALAGGDGRDTLLGGAGADTLDGGGHADVLRGGGRDDLLAGGAGRDRLFGGVGADTLRGGGGNDRLEGAGGRDRLFGGPGSDRLDGGGGRDVLFGGAGADVFVFAQGGGRDRVNGFGTGIDGLELDAGLLGGAATGAEVVAQFASVVAAGVRLDFGDGDSLLLAGLAGTAGLEDDIAIV